MAEIYCIGDSITYGAFDERGGWAERLKQHFHAEKLNDLSVGATLVYNLGVSGDATDDILRRLEPELKARQKRWSSPKDIYILAVGINDARAKDNRENVYMTPEEFRSHLGKIKETISAFSRRIIVVGLTRAVEEKVHLNSPDTLYWNERIEQFDEALRQFAEEQNLIFVDIFQAMGREHYEEWLSDGVHPNTAGHEWMFNRILPEVIKMLDSKA